MKNMKYCFSTGVRDNDILRKSFNDLTQKTFCFDFTDWYQRGHWGDLYIPNVLLDDEKVISNVSVNLMQFLVDGTIKNYIQLGTVMTDSSYRGQGLNRDIMERILGKYENRVDGIYLFGNDSVLNYYPKFGFRPSKEYEYFLPYEQISWKAPYTLERINLSDTGQCEHIYDIITSCSEDRHNQNDAMYMNKNLGLYQFWLAAVYNENVYYLPETDAYIIASKQEQILHIYQIFGKNTVDFTRLAASFGNHIAEAVLGFTPVHKNVFQIREHKEEDCTLFILGKDLESIEQNQMMFPVLSHA